MRSQILHISTDQVQGRLLKLAAAFLVVYSVALTLSPAVRARAWFVELRWDHWLGLLAWAVVFGLAHRQSARWLPERDPYLLPLVGLLSGWGMLTIWRLLPTFGLRQSAWIIIAGGVLIAGLRLPSDLTFLRRYKYLWLTGSLLLTALTLFLGVNPLGYGPRMWLGCCGVYLQPSEPLKLLLIAYLAAYLADCYPFLLPPPRSPASSDQEAPSQSTVPLGPHPFTPASILPCDYAPGSQVAASVISASTSRAPQSPPPSSHARAPLLPLLAPTLIMTGLALALLVVQRDLGTAAIFLFLYGAVVFVASGRRRVLLVGVLTLVFAALAGYGLFDVVQVRVDAWLNPWLDPSGRSFQIVQSLLAVANGGLLGRGVGVGSPSLVPLAHSDLVYAAIAEEGGLVGSLGLLVAIALLVSRGLRIAMETPDAYRRYLAVGLVAYLAGQSVLIIGGSLRLLPLTGVTLPFVSYGGSSLLVSFVSLLLLLHISNRVETTPVVLPFPQVYQYLGGFLFGALGLAGLATGWWAVYRGPDLLTRTDNPRRAIADRSVRRGAILDRHNYAINASLGAPGEYTRHTMFPDLSNVVGYTNPSYGQSGLEASLDETLRGLRGNPGLTIWWHHLLYGQPPPGLDVRLSLDLDLQRLAGGLLEGRKGALVLLNARSGEILVMDSHPTFDANKLEQTWTMLIEDPDSPLLNRAAQGYYPLGSLEESLFSQPFSELGLDAAPQIRLLGETQPGGRFLDYSPVQVALAAAVVSNGGTRPAPVLAMAVNTPQAGWVVLPALEEPRQVVPPALAASIALSKEVLSLGIWELVVAVGDRPGQVVVWYVGGTLPDWPGAPLALALVLEQEGVGPARAIGRGVLEAVTGK